jgi:hypothetical protein
MRDRGRPGTSGFLELAAEGNRDRPRTGLVEVVAEDHEGDAAPGEELGPGPAAELSRDDFALFGIDAVVVYEIPVVDTGSLDRTKEIARSFRVKAVDFVWVDDFAVARNEAMKPATLAQRATRAPHEFPAADVVRCACDPDPDGAGGETVVDHIRLFPLRKDVRWTYRVHEQILQSLRRANVPARWTDLTVRHAGYASSALRARKLDRDIATLKRERDERSDDPFVLFNLVAIAVERREWQEGLGFLKRSLAGSASTDSIVRKLYALIARAPDNGNLPRGPAHLPRGNEARSRGCRVVVPHRGSTPAPGRIGRCRAIGGGRF